MTLTNYQGISMSWSTDARQWFVARWQASSARMQAIMSRIVAVSPSWQQSRISFSGITFDHSWSTPLGSLISSSMAVYVLTAYSYRQPTKRCENLGASKQLMKNMLKKIPWREMINALSRQPGFLMLRKINKWNLSLSASSNKWWIHPLSLCIMRRLLRCLAMPPTIPGTPATVSRMRHRCTHLATVMFYFLQEVRKSQLLRMDLMPQQAIHSFTPFGSTCYTFISSVAPSGQIQCAILWYALWQTRSLLGRKSYSVFKFDTFFISFQTESVLTTIYYINFRIGKLLILQIPSKSDTTSPN